MINRINHNTQNKQTSFGMSKLSNLEELIKIQSLNASNIREAKEHTDEFNVLLKLDGTFGKDNILAATARKDRGSVLNFLGKIFPFFVRKEKVAIEIVSPIGFAPSLHELAEKAANRLGVPGNINGKKEALKG